MNTSRKTKKLLACRIWLGGCECASGYRFVCVCDVVFSCVRVSVFSIGVSLHVACAHLNGDVREHANVY